MPTLDSPINWKTFVRGSYWQLKTSVNCYANATDLGLATQACSGRSFEVYENTLENNRDGHYSSRLPVKLLEDGYKCWLEYSDLEGQVESRGAWKPELLTSAEIQSRLTMVLDWVENASFKENKYLWGGTLGPDFDCSGLVQTAFANSNIWLPRDAYQQKEFCTPISFCSSDFKVLRPGDLLFFGSSQLCNHVAIYKGQGSYWHSSGIEYGHNGISCDSLNPLDKESIAAHYRDELIGAGRVDRCHHGTSLA